MSHHVYIFRGAPAVGKGTVAPEFVKLLPMPVALIEQDKFRWGLHLIGRSIEEVTQEEHRLAHTIAKLTYGQYLKSGGYDIVLEGLFTWDNEQAAEGSAKELVDLAAQYGFDSTCVVLKADKDELLRRNAARQYSVPPAEFEELYNKVYARVDPSEIIVDSTGQTPEETLSQLKESLL